MVCTKSSMHQEFCTPRYLLSSLDNINVVFGAVFGVLVVLGVLGVFGVRGVLGVVGVLGVLCVFGIRWCPWRRGQGWI